MTHVPDGPLNVTLADPLMVQPDVDVPSMLKVTGLPEPDALTVQPDVDARSMLRVAGLPGAPPVGVTWYVSPTCGVGAVEVKVIAWGRPATAGTDGIVVGSEPVYFTCEPELICWIA